MLSNCNSLKLVYEFANTLLPTDLMNFFSYRHQTHTTNLLWKCDHKIFGQFRILEQLHMVIDLSNITVLVYEILLSIWMFQ